MNGFVKNAALFSKNHYEADGLTHSWLSNIATKYNIATYIYLDPARPESIVFICIFSPFLPNIDGYGIL